jgi:hypothetical protein
MGWNPANWAITDTLQGQEGGYTLDNNWLGQFGNSSSSLTNSNSNSVDFSNPTGFTGVLGTNSNNQTGGVSGANTGGTDQSAVTGGSTSGGSGGAGYNSEDLAFIDSQIGYLQSLANDITTKYNQGKQGVESSYNKNYSEATQQRGRSLEDLKLKEEDTARGKDRAIGQVNTYARTLGDSVRRKLGMASGSDSSAYQVAAPGAIARDASGKRTGVLEDYGTNFRNLDLTKKRAETDYKSLLDSLTEQRNQKLYGLETGIADQRDQLAMQEANFVGERQKLLGGGYNRVRMAQQPYLDQINSRKASINDLFTKYNPTYDKKEVVVNAPSLRDYMVDRTQISGGGQVEDQYAPYQLKKKNEEIV